jgi:hypothetical protein
VPDRRSVRLEAMKRTIALLASCAALGACGPGRERSVNEMFDETNRAIVNTAAAYENRVENELGGTERRLDEEANAQLSRIEANAANALDGNEVVANGQ